MNDSLYSIDRSTHAKIVALALIAATAVAGVSIAIRCSGMRGERKLLVSPRPASLP